MWSSRASALQGTRTVVTFYPGSILRAHHTHARSQTPRTYSCMALKPLRIPSFRNTPVDIFVGFKASISALSLSIPRKCCLNFILCEFSVTSFATLALFWFEVPLLYANQCWRKEFKISRSKCISRFTNLFWRWSKTVKMIWSSAALWMGVSGVTNLRKTSAIVSDGVVSVLSVLSSCSADFMKSTSGSSRLSYNSISDWTWSWYSV